jgi:hypothetical protein
MKTRDPLLLLGVLTVYVLLGSSMLTTGHDWGGDFSAYIMQAQSIVDHTIPEFVSQNTFTVERSAGILGHGLYPWGYPLLISPLYATFGSSLVAFKTLNLVLYALFLICLYALFAKRLSPAYRFALVVLFAASPAMLVSLNHVLSDVSFLFFSTLSMLLIDRSTWRRGSPSYSLVEGLVVGCSIFCAYIIRPLGLFLLPTLLAVQIAWLSDSRQRGAVTPRRSLFYVLIPYASFIGLVVFSSLVLYQNPVSNWAYLQRTSALLVLKHFYRYVILPALILYDAPFQSLEHHLVALISVPLAVTGMIRNWRREYHFILYSAFSLALYVIWPFFQGLRFLYPILPFFVYFVFRGAQAISGKIFGDRRKLARLVEACLISVVLLLSLDRSLGLALENLQNDRQQSGPYDAISQEMFAFIRTATQPEDIVAFEKPRVLRMMTGRTAYRAGSCDDLGDADYLLISKNEIGPYALNECAQYPGLQAAFENQGFVIYRIGER